MNDEITLKYQWRKTWPDQKNDFAGSDGDTGFGRFYIFKTPDGAVKWRWFFGVLLEKEWHSGTGMCDTAREAARELERCYDWAAGKAQVQK